ncbi:MAG: restriction endonuclease subunit S [Deltaproteobacteria bacterium]|nr:restriction endonuclease subunit S [Deltaproteobacteria bacterium]
MMKTITFSDLVEINPRVQLNKSEEYPFVEMSVVEPGNRYVRPNQTRIYNGGGAKFMPGDILFARITPCLENGKIAQYIYNKAIAGFGSTEFFVFRARPKISNPGFVFYLVNSEIIRKPAEKNMSGASGRQRADLKSIVNIKIPFTALPTQRKIASILSAYDDLIENNLRRIKILEEMAQNLYHEWFIKFRFPGHENTRFVNSPLGRIPEGWEIGKLGDISHVTTGYAFKSKDWSKDGIAVIKIKNIKPGNLVDVDQVDHVPKNIISSRLQKYWLKNGDIIIAMTGATAGKVGKIRSKKPLLLNQRVAKIGPKSGYVKFVWCTMSTPEAEKRFYALADGAAQPNMSSTQIENSEVIIPLTDLLKQFEETVSPLIDSVDNMILKNQILRQTRDLLLPKLISGEVDVTDIEIPETIEV